MLIDYANIPTDSKPEPVHRFSPAAVRLPSRPEQSAGQQGLHVSAAIGNQVDIDALSDHAIDYAVRFERSLAVLAYTEGEQLLRVGATLGSFQW